MGLQLIFAVETNGNINVSKLSAASYQANTSNIINILDKYLIRKE